MHGVKIAFTATLLLLVTATAQADDASGPLLREASEQAERGAHANAIEILSKVIRLDPKQADAYYLRGRALFCDGQVKEAVADFDRYVELVPQAESRQWERG
ncbi:MAG TPA: tetratricopeptide repeat protein, partial [Pirellulaceae bacterium]|nr:tetratricopeptide repeat protein [Pirellulaceae bacterium]